MDVKPGYQQTEVGVIPEDWLLKKLSSTATLRARIGWQGLTTAEYLNTGDYFLVTGTEFKNGYIDWDSCHYVSESRYKQDKNIQLKEHDVLVTKDGTIGKVALITHLEKPATLNSGVFVIRPIGDAFDPQFFYYLLLSNVFAEFLNQLSAGSTINHLYQKDFVNFVFQVPETIKEQQAIAEALSDADAYIESLDQLITKKRLIKQGVMQELLTGKRRLPGFDGEWKWVALQGIVDFANGKPHEGDISEDGEYLLITLDSIGADGCLKSKHKRVSHYDDSLKKNDIVTVLSTVVSNLDQGNILGLADLVPEDNKYVLNQRMGRIRLKVNGSPRFVCLQMNRSREHFKQRGQGTSQKHIYQRDIDSLVIPFPSPAEQTAIAEVLTHLDLELEALERQREKARILKQGMMQELLTGRIRLI